MHKRAVETIFRTVDIDRVGYARPGHASLHPLDASLNLPLERYSLEMRRRVAAGAASRSFDEALSDLSDSTGAVVPKRQAEQLAVRPAEDFDAFYEARRAAAGEPVPAESVVVLTFDGKGVVRSHPILVPTILHSVSPHHYTSANLNVSESRYFDETHSTDPSSGAISPSTDLYPPSSL